MGRDVLPIVTESRHGPELILGYLDAAWADCVVSVEPGLRFFVREPHWNAIWLRLALNVAGDANGELRGSMDNSKDYEVGYKRPPRSRQFKKGQSGNPGGRRRKNGPIQVNAQGIFDEIFQVSVAGRVRTMSAKEVEIRQILKKALEKKDFRSMAYLLGLFEKHGGVVTPKTSGVIMLPTNRMPFRMAMMIAKKYGLPEDWKKRHIAWGRKQFEATMTDEERECEAAGVIP